MDTLPARVDYIGIGIEFHQTEWNFTSKKLVSVVAERMIHPSPYGELVHEGLCFISCPLHGALATLNTA